MLLTFKDIKGIRFDEATAAVLDMATAMGQDAQTSAVQLGKALNDPIKGIASLSKVGIQFTNDQKAVIKSLVETGDKAGAQKIILDELASQMGTAAEAARGTLGGALTSLKNAFDNLLEGDSGAGGVTGTRQAIEDLITTLNDPGIKRGVDSTANGLLTIANAAIRLIAQLGNAGSALAEFFAENDKKSLASLKNKRTGLESDLFAVQRGSLSSLKQVYFGNDNVSLLQTQQQNIDRIKGEIAEIDRLISARNRAAAQPGASPRGYDKERRGTGIFANVNTDPSAATPAKPKTGGAAAKPADPDDAGKRRLEQLREEAALLDAVTDGETKASDAAKLRYDLTEGELKDISPALKQQLLDQQAVVDKKHEDIAAEEERKKKFEETKEAYADLREELRTPTEIALEDAMAKVDALNAAMQAGIATKADYDAALSRIAGGLIDRQPDFGGLAPEVGGAFGELGKLDQAAAAEDKWYQDSLARLEAFRSAKAGNIAAADAQEEQLEALHQARMQQIEGARQQATLSIASDFFGQLAQLQRSENSKIAAVGKAAAIAQALINTYQSATAAYAAMASIPYVGPALGIAAAAAAIAAGLANVAQIRAQPTGGYAQGGYTGPGGKFTPAGIVHKGEGVLSQEDIAALGGPSGFHALREAIQDGSMRERMYAWAGYADGGLVTPSAPRLASPDFGGFPQGAAGLSGATVSNALRVYLSMNQDQLVEQLANHPAMEKKIVVVAGENGKAITANW
jgi:hypothetical protein